MFNITGHLCLMSFDFPLLNSLHFEDDFLFCMFNDAVFIPHRAFQLGLVWLVYLRDGFNCLSCRDLCNVRTGINHCLYRAMSFL